jgi:hypothetical protein
MVLSVEREQEVWGVYLDGVIEGLGAQRVVDVIGVECRLTELGVCHKLMEADGSFAVSLADETRTVVCPVVERLIRILGVRKSSDLVVAVIQERIKSCASRRSARERSVSGAA